MQPLNWVIRIEVEPNDAVLIRVIAAITRRRCELVSISSNLNQNRDLLQITCIITQTAENVKKLSLQLVKQIDILSLTFCKQESAATCKTDHQENFLTL